MYCIACMIPDHTSGMIFQPCLHYAPLDQTNKILDVLCFQNCIQNLICFGLKVNCSNDHMQLDLLFHSKVTLDHNKCFLVRLDSHLSNDNDLCQWRAKLLPS